VRLRRRCSAQRLQQWAMEAATYWGGKMVTVSEVVVGIKSQGADDTKEDLEGVTDQTEETTDALEEQSDEMTEMAQSFSGALQAATVGLAAASAGLLSQVPVLGQLFDSLFAIVNAVALQMDQVLRPVLGRVSKFFFSLSDTVANFNGIAGDLVGIVGSILTFLGAVVAPVALLLQQFGLLSGVVSAFTTAGSVLVGVLGTIAGAISLPAVAVAALATAIATAIAVILTDFRGWRTKGIKIIKDLWNRLKEIVGAGVDRIKEFGSNMFQAGKALIGRLIDGIISAKNRVVNAVQDIIASTPLPDLGVSVGGGGGGGSFSGGSSGGTSSGGSSGGSLPGGNSGSTKVFLNGREVGRGTNSERFDESARRGQTF